MMVESRWRRQEETRGSRDEGQRVQGERERERERETKMMAECAQRKSETTKGVGGKVRRIEETSRAREE
jgi:hypothetical protein